VRADGGGTHLPQPARHPVDVELRGVDVEHQGGGDQLLAWPADGTAVLPPDAFTGLCQERRGIQHRIPPC
jgi:hypothetical protein